MRGKYQITPELRHYIRQYTNVRLYMWDMGEFYVKLPTIPMRFRVKYLAPKVPLKTVRKLLRERRLAHRKEAKLLKLIHGK
jgi:hypothetical protein